MGKEPHPSAPGSGRGVWGATGVLPTTFPRPHRFFGRESPKRLITSRQLPLPGLWSAWPGRLRVLHGHTPLRAGMTHGTWPLCGPVALAPSLGVLLESKHCPKNQQGLLYRLGSVFAK